MDGMGYSIYNHVIKSDHAMATHVSFICWWLFMLFHPYYFQRIIYNLPFFHGFFWGSFRVYLIQFLGKDNAYHPPKIANIYFKFKGATKHGLESFLFHSSFTTTPKNPDPSRSNRNEGSNPILRIGM